MILQSLVTLAEGEGLLGDPGFQSLPVHYRVHIDKVGRVLGVQSTLSRLEGSKKETPQSLPVPIRRIRGGLAVVPDILVDKGQYMFGLGDPKKEAGTKDLHKRLAECVAAMMAQVGEIAVATGDEGAAAQHKAMLAIQQDPAPFISAWCGAGETIEVPQGADRIVTAPRAWKKNTSALFVFVMNEEMVCRRQKVRAWVAAQNIQSNGTNTVTEICLVSGQSAEPVPNHPKFELRGDKGPLPLISFNQRSFEHYGREGNENAPIGKAAADGYVAALRRLLAPGNFEHPTTGKVLPRRNLAISEKTTVVFWSAPSQSVDPLEDLMLQAVLDGSEQASVEQVLAAYSATRAGRPPILEDAAPFFTMVLTREKSRVFLRTAELHTVGGVARAVRSYFSDLEICHRVGQREYRGLRTLIRATMRHHGRADARSPPEEDLGVGLYRCALDDRLQFPASALASIVRRIRAHDDEGPSVVRIALIKAVLNRNLHKEFTVSLDENTTSTAYHLGRLFALLEKAQQEATDANAGIGERYLGTAMSAPALVFPRLMKLSHHHLGKIGGGREVNLQKMMDSIVSRIPPMFPLTQALVDQGSFMIGYHHQRSTLWAPKDPAVPDSSPA